MYIDARIFIGLTFTFMGVLLVALGFATSGSAALYVRSLGINLNLWWGLVIALFGQLMYHLGRRAQLRLDTTQLKSPQPSAISRKNLRRTR